MHETLQGSNNPVNLDKLTCYLASFMHIVGDTFEASDERRSLTNVRPLYINGSSVYYCPVRIYPTAHSAQTLQR